MRKRYSGLIVSALLLSLASCTAEPSSQGGALGLGATSSEEAVKTAALHRGSSRFLGALTRLFDRICTTRSGEYNCNCQRWWNPDRVDCDGGGGVNECAEGLDDCDANATCTNTVDAYTCECNDGFAGDGTSCADVDECADGSAECDVNAACANAIGGYECACNDGYVGDGFDCEPEDVDECAAGTDNCDANATCANTSGGFTCTCNEGYSGDGTTCTEDPPGPVDECALGTDDCDDNASCTDTATAFECSCNFGYAGDGVTCADINECAEGADNCDVNAACSNTAGAFTCTCNEGYSGDGTTCTENPPEPVDECALGLDNCSVNAICTDTASAFTCACVPGYVGDGVMCSDINECSAGTDNCSNNATCTNTVGAFTCACNAGYAGNGVTCTDVNECSAGTDNCSNNATCSNTTGSFTCACNTGYTGNGVTCTDVNECAAGTDDCPDGAVCNNTPGSFACTCPDGTGDGTACGCDLTGTFALLTELDIEWDPILFNNAIVIVQGGSDTTFSWAIRRFDQDGSTIDSEQIACGGTAPDFCSPLLSQAYAQYVPDTLWELPTVQHAFSTIVLPGPPQPGGAFVGPMEAAFSGLTVADPLAPWPSSRTSPDITWIDEDVDGQLGVTSFLRLTGTSTSCGGLAYAGLPIPATAELASEIYTGSRSVAQLSGSIGESCDVIAGELLGPDNGMPRLDGRVAGCKHVDGTACTVEEIDSLDLEGGEAGQRILGARFTMVRVADDISCAQVRALTFP